ncbi:MAG: endonuclease MutS2 [Acidobacteria bacterium]|nr:MAG: endonuclease MutS2 [Acidobacteriota bacterium]
MAPLSSPVSSTGNNPSMDFSLDALEYYRLKDLLGRYVSTSAARYALDDLEPILDADKLDNEHAITAEAMQYLREHRVVFTDIPLLAQAIDKLAVAGSVLDVSEIEAIQLFLAHIEGLRMRWNQERESFPKLAQRAQRLPDLRDLSKHLRRAVQNGEIDENYSPDLRRIRRAIAAARSRLTEKLESMLRSPAYSSQLQEQLVTVRNGRFVIPVRTEQKRAVDGIIHGTSSSGATVFMEPLAVVEMNNELVRLQDEEQAEIARILAELTDLIQTSAGPIESARALSAYLELVFAKARFGRDFDCVRPDVSPGSLLSLINARHPLLEDNLRREHSAMTPISLDMDAGRRVLVISGPNAGGKTVVLKTTGLLALMAQSGMPVPAEEATLPIFDRVLADIGDQQSITNHLSTFSAHVLAIKSMLESATERSLILLDEIGSSTEPGEGAALARAVLEQFRDIGAFVVATTHYNRLKLYAETTPGIANAAMEFNEITLQPTYRLIHGLSGASSGLKIAERLQLPRPVLESAVAFLDTADVEAAGYVEELRRRIVELEQEKGRLERERRDFEDWRQKELDQLKEQHRQEIANVEKKLDRIVQEMSDRASRELESVRDESVKKFQKRLANAKAQATREVAREKEQMESSAKLSSADASRVAVPIKEGQAVRVMSLSVTGRVTTVQGEQAEVLVGNIKLRRPMSDLEVVGQTPLKLPQNVHVNISTKPLEKNEINIIGRRVDEAVEIADKFLDDAFLAQMNTVRIVHGMGTGALRQAISELLNAHPHVSHFESASQSEGGRGVTIVTLRS